MGIEYYRYAVANTTKFGYEQAFKMVGMNNIEGHHFQNAAKVERQEGIDQQQFLIGGPGRKFVIGGNVLNAM
jgi:hypothetical protein